MSRRPATRPDALRANVIRYIGPSPAVKPRHNYETANKTKLDEDEKTEATDPGRVFFPRQSAAWDDEVLKTTPLQDYIPVLQLLQARSMNKANRRRAEEILDNNNVDWKPFLLRVNKFDPGVRCLLLLSLIHI